MLQGIPSRLMRNNPPVEVDNNALWSRDHRRLCSPIRVRRFKDNRCPGAARMVKGRFHIIHLDMQNNSCCFPDGNERIGTEHNRYRPAVEFSEASVFDADRQPDDVARRGAPTCTPCAAGAHQGRPDVCAGNVQCAPCNLATFNPQPLRPLPLAPRLTPPPPPQRQG